MLSLQLQLLKPVDGKICTKYKPNVTIIFTSLHFKLNIPHGMLYAS